MSTLRPAFGLTFVQDEAELIRRWSFHWLTIHPARAAEVP